MLTEKEIELMGLAEAAKSGEVWTCIHSRLRYEHKRGGFSPLLPQDKEVLYAVNPAAILSLLSDLDGARFAAAQHKQTVECQAKCLADPLGGIEVIEHGTLKRAMFTTDLGYGLYLAERRDAQPDNLARSHASHLCEVIQLLGLDITTVEQGHITGAIKKLQADHHAAAPVITEHLDALGYVPSDDIYMPFMCLIEDYMSAVDYHGSQKGEKCEAAEAAIRAALIKLAAPASGMSNGYVLAPHYRGYANLGTGQYIMNHSAAGNPAEFVISIATEAEKEGRVVGDEMPNAPGNAIQPEVMAVRIGFANVAGLDAMEARLRHLRAEHFPSAAPVSPQRPATSIDFEAIGQAYGVAPEVVEMIVKAALGGAA